MKNFILLISLFCFLSELKAKRLNENLMKRAAEKALNEGSERAIERAIERDRQEKSFFDAARYGATINLERLIQEGFDVNKKDAFGRTALYLALLEAEMGSAQMLIENGARVNKNDKGEVILYDLFRENIDHKSEVLKFLFRQGFNTNERDSLGNNLLHIAIKISDLRLAKDLIKYGTDPFAKNYQGKYPLELIKESSISFFDELHLKKLVRQQKPKIIKPKNSFLLDGLRRLARVR